MKKYIFLVSIIFTSCSTIKVEEQIVQDFIKEKKLKDNPNTTPTYLIEESGSNEKVLDYYEFAYLDKNSPVDKKRVEVLPNDFNNWPINLKEINDLKLTYKANNLPYQWESKNFNSLDISIIRRKELDSKIASQELPLTSSGNIISKPIITSDKKYALFYYHSFLPMASISKRIFLVEKIKNKWIIKAEFYDPNVFN